MNFFSAEAEKNVKTLTLWARLVLWCAIILLFSSIPSYDGQPLDLETIPGVIKFFCRKLAHMFEYAYLTIFFYRAVERSWPKRNQIYFLCSFAFVILFAAIDECRQSFIFGRMGSPFDIFVDAVGSLIGSKFLAPHDREEKTNS